MHNFGLEPGIGDIKHYTKNIFEYLINETYIIHNSIVSNWSVNLYNYENYIVKSQNLSNKYTLKYLEKEGP